MKIDYQVKYIIIADNREEAEAAILELHENRPIVSFSFVKKTEDGKFTVEGQIGLSTEKVLKFRDILEVDE